MQCAEVAQADEIVAGWERGMEQEHTRALRKVEQKAEELAHEIGRAHV